MLEFVKYEHIDKLKQDVLPKVDEFTRLIEGYKNDNNDMKLCVRTFDENLCDKANKSALVTMQSKLMQEFVSVRLWQDIEQTLNANDQKREVIINQQKSELKAFKDNISQHIDNLCTDITNKKLNSYEKVCNSFQKFFNQDELSEILDRKADLELI